MSHRPSLVSRQLGGETSNHPADDLTLDMLPRKFTLTRTDDALTAYGGPVTWSSFLKQLGIIEGFAEGCPLPRTNPTAAPARRIVHSVAVSALVEGKRFCHVRWLTGDPAIATIIFVQHLGGRRPPAPGQRDERRASARVAADVLASNWPQLEAEGG